MKKTKLETALLDQINKKKYLIIILLSFAASLAIQVIGLERAESGDWISHYSLWAEAIKDRGLAGAVVSDYPAAFNLLLFFLVKIGAATNIGMKWLAYPFQITIAVVFFTIVLLIKKSKEAAAYAFAFSLLCPSLVLNVSSWGQVDVYYTAVCMWAVLCYILYKMNGKGKIGKNSNKLRGGGCTL